MHILTKINWVDVLALILVLRMSYVAFQDGLSHEILPVIGSVFMIVFSLHYYQKISSFLYDIGFVVPILLLNPVIFLALNLLIGLLFRVLKSIIDNVIKVSWHPLIEKFGGLIAGLTRGVVLASMVLIFLVIIPLPYLQRSMREKSLTGMYFLRVGPELYEKMSLVLPAMRLDGLPVNSKELTNKLVADKSMPPMEPVEAIDLNKYDIKSRSR